MNNTQINNMHDMNEVNDLNKYLMTKIDIGHNYELKNKIRVLILNKNYILFINAKQELILMDKNFKKKILKKFQDISGLTLLENNKLALIIRDIIYIYLKKIIKNHKLNAIFETKDNKIIEYNKNYDYIYICYKYESNKENFYDILAFLFIIYMIVFIIYALYYFIERNILKFIIIVLICTINFYILEKIIYLYKIYKKYCENIHYKKIFMHSYINKIIEGVKNGIICISINENKIIFFDYKCESSKFDELIIPLNFDYIYIIKISKTERIVITNEIFYIIIFIYMILFYK